MKAVAGEAFDSWPPEQRGREITVPLAAWGRLCWACLTGQFPYKSGPTSQLCRGHCWCERMPIALAFKYLLCVPVTSSAFDVWFARAPHTSKCQTNWRVVTLWLRCVHTCLQALCLNVRGKGTETRSIFFRITLRTMAVVRWWVTAQAFCSHLGDKNHFPPSTHTYIYNMIIYICTLYTCVCVTSK